MENTGNKYFQKLTPFDRIANGLFAILVGLGIGFAHSYVLEVRGRKTGRVFKTPVNLLVRDGRRYLVASRGETNWVRNARAAGRVALVKGSERKDYRVREIPAAERPEIIKDFLDRFALSVQRYYPVAKGSPTSAFVDIAGRYPVFELVSE